MSLVRGQQGISRTRHFWTTVQNWLASDKPVSDVIADMDNNDEQWVCLHYSGAKAVRQQS